MPTIYLIGDSTVDIGTLPFRGWGWGLSEYVANDVTVHNAAKSGRSTLSFLNEGLFEPIRNSLQVDDLLMIQFGHNDEKSDPALHTDANGSFQEYLKMYCRVALEKGALPVLISPVCRRLYAEDGSLRYTHGQYPDAVRKVAQELGLPFIDLKAASRQLYLSGTAEDAAKLFVQLAPGEHPDYPNGLDDRSHFNANGSRRIAGLVAEAMKNYDCLKRYIK